MKTSSKAQKSNKFIAATDTSQEHGVVNFYGNVDKQQAKRRAFHKRWVVLRGLHLFWYRNPLDDA